MARIYKDDFLRQPAINFGNEIAQQVMKELVGIKTYGRKYLAQKVNQYIFKNYQKLLQEYGLELKLQRLDTFQGTQYHMRVITSEFKSFMFVFELRIKQDCSLKSFQCVEVVVDRDDCSSISIGNILYRLNHQQCNEYEERIIEELKILQKKYNCYLPFIQLEELYKAYSRI